MNNDISRENWLQSAVESLTPHFSKAGFAMPPVKVSCGWPAGSNPRKTLGQCWPRERSGDGANQIFISPKIEEPIEVLDTLVHELCHAVDDCFSGHGPDFKDIARSVGLEGPARTAHASEELIIHLMTVAASLGEYPHKAIVLPAPNKGVAGRNKAKCTECGYEVTLLKKWATYGAPICPKDNTRMVDVALMEEAREYEEAASGGVAL